MNMKPFYNTLGHVFWDPKLLQAALQHRSQGKTSNERLEFLGDALLGFIMAEEIFRRYPAMEEGVMSRLRSSLVNGTVLAEIALELGVDRYLCLGQGEERSGGRQRPSILADALEAIIAAIYLDAGITVCQSRVLQWFASRLDQALSVYVQKDAKSSLQEWMQAHQYPLPIYTVVATMGQAHDQLFKVCCRVEGLPHETYGEASSRRQAEQLAATYYLEVIDVKE